MSRKAIECENCGSEYTIVYDAEELADDPIHCPFCGEVASPDEDDVEVDTGDWE
jgi:ribosomal protein S27E